jgi:SAM-dependent methyltransferase
LSSGRIRRVQPVRLVSSAPSTAAGLRLDPATLESWPERERREPPRSNRHFLVLAPLAEQIRAAVARHFPRSTDLRVLDIGCGLKPYLPLVASKAASYRGLDVAEGPYVDDIGVAEELPYEDASFDLVLCTQVLEHVDDPQVSVREIWRVLSPEGVALVSTHGVYLYHPNPPDSDRDYWRWTHAGLARLFREQGDWAELEVLPSGDFFACVGYLLAQFVDEVAEGAAPDAVRRGLVRTLNAGAGWVDKRFPRRARVPSAGSLSANYLVVARKA